MKQWIRAVLVALMAAAGLLLGASAASAGDPSQWDAIAGDPTQWESVAGDPSQWGAIAGDPSQWGLSGGGGAGKVDFQD